MGLFVCFLGPHQVLAQEVDSVRQSFFLNPKPQSFTASPHSERNIHSFKLPESGIFEEPASTTYYTLPFKGQYYLDLAVEAYREQEADRLGLQWLSQFLNAISPFINNRYQLGLYDVNSPALVDRDNPLFQSYGEGNRQ